MLIIAPILLCIICCSAIRNDRISAVTPFMKLKIQIIIVIGANPTENHPVAKLFKMQQKGSSCVMDLVALKTCYSHVKFKPGSDVALLNSIMNVIIEENLFNTNILKDI